MDEIHNRNASTLSFEELYRNAYNLVLHKHGGLLYEGVQDRLSVHLRRSGAKLVKLAREESATIGDGQSYKLLEEMAYCWKEHRITMVMVRDIFMYMDRTYVPQHRKRPVYDLGLWLFRRVVWERSMEDDGADEDLSYEGQRMATSMGNNAPLKTAENDTSLGTVTSTLLLQVIHADRLHRLSDAPQRTSLLKELIHMLLELAHANSGQYSDSPILGAGGQRMSPNGNGGVDTIPVYERDFEEVFLGESQDFYRMESTSRLSHSVGLGLNFRLVNNEVRYSFRFAFGFCHCIPSSFVGHSSCRKGPCHQGRRQEEILLRCQEGTCQEGTCQEGPCQEVQLEEGRPRQEESTPFQWRIHHIH